MAKFSKNLFSYFTTIEIWQIIDLLIERRFIDKPHGQMLADKQNQELFVNKITNRSIYNGISIIVSNYVVPYDRWSEVVAKFVDLKRKIDGRGVPGWLIQNGIKLPKRQITHKDFQQPISVSDHAWDRWLERFLSVYPGQYQANDARKFEILQDLFKEAIPEEVDPRSRIARLASNRFQTSTYYLNKKTRVRFVISENLTSLVTVEIAVRGGK